MDNDHALHRKESFHDDNQNHDEHIQQNRSFMTPIAETAKATTERLNIIIQATQNTLFPFSYRRNLGGRPKIDFRLNFSIDAWSILVGGYGATALGFYLEDYYSDLDFTYSPDAAVIASQPNENDDLVTKYFKKYASPRICFYCHQSMIFGWRIASRFIGGGLLYFGCGEIINLVLRRRWGAITSTFAGAITGAYFSRGQELGKMFRVTTGFAFYTSVMEFIFSLFVFSFAKIYD